jgi:hypothetical protein
LGDGVSWLEMVVRGLVCEEDERTVEKKRVLVVRAVREAVAATRYMMAVVIVVLFVWLICVDGAEIGLNWLVGF